jgi:hypothetical protein
VPVVPYSVVAISVCSREELSRHSGSEGKRERERETEERQREEEGNRYRVILVQPIPNAVAAAIGEGSGRGTLPPAADEDDDEHDRGDEQETARPGRGDVVPGELVRGRRLDSGLTRPQRRLQHRQIRQLRGPVSSAWNASIRIEEEEEKAHFDVEGGPVVCGGSLEAGEDVILCDHVALGTDQHLYRRVRGPLLLLLVWHRWQKVEPLWRLARDTRHRRVKPARQSERTR